MDYEKDFGYYCEFYDNCSAMTIGNCSGRGELDGSKRCPHTKFSNRVKRRMLTKFEWMMVKAIYENAIEESSNGRTLDFESNNEGSMPSSSSKEIR